MLEMSPVDIDGVPFQAVTMKLPKTNFMAVTNDVGYIMCGALDVQLLNEKLADREIVAGRAVGVRTVEQLLGAPLELVTLAAEARGIQPGMTGREALLKM
ncbi:YunC family protein [Natribacillus halophilus]|uniref:Uncharacterized protein YunC, DUF1805 family n=1 Tax=Natribacillus halophilus TaxID=549003 RepID=A0A1G8RNW5_9BACI|nr:DUF1805 domain-containing protein [Natribacillus halophilus]SDJ18185.1 Uncharacterized protein YunC, DUF1805 family [Natribacillus halophilus]